MRGAPPKQTGKSFLDLPPEIRNEIYMLLLPNLPYGALNMYKLRAFNRNRYEISGRMSMLPLLSLLKTGKQVHLELAPIVYGAVTFRFRFSAFEVRWLRSIGSMKQHIRRVRITMGFSPKVVSSGLHQLKQAKCLQILETEVGSRPPPPSTIIQPFKPLLRSLKRSRKGEAAAGEVWNIVRIIPYSLGSPPLLAKLEAQRAEVYETEVRASLKELLR